jgi:hypothetical protein
MLTTASIEQLIEYGTVSLAQQQELYSSWYGQEKAKYDAWYGQEKAKLDAWLGQQGEAGIAAYNQQLAALNSEYFGKLPPSPSTITVAIKSTVNGTTATLTSEDASMYSRLMAAGYNQPISLSVPPSYAYKTPSKYTAQVTTTMPQGAVIAQVARSASPQHVLAKLASHGWDTHARSVDPLSVGKCFEFTAAEDVTGACLIIGPKGLDGRGIHQFTHCLVVDGSGVRVYEGGRFKEHLRGSHNALASLRIYRQEDNSVVYVVTLGTETIVYTSTAHLAVPAMFDVYVYCYLYASGDKVTSAEYKTGKVQYGSV